MSLPLLRVGALAAAPIFVLSGSGDPAAGSLDTVAPDPGTAASGSVSSQSGNRGLLRGRLGMIRIGGTLRRGAIRPVSRFTAALVLMAGLVVWPMAVPATDWEQYARGALATAPNPGAASYLNHLARLDAPGLAKASREARAELEVRRVRPLPPALKQLVATHQVVVRSVARLLVEQPILRFPPRTQQSAFDFVLVTEAHQRMVMLLCLAARDAAAEGRMAEGAGFAAAALSLAEAEQTDAAGYLDYLLALKDAQTAAVTVGILALDPRLPPEHATALARQLKQLEAATPPISTIQRMEDDRMARTVAALADPTFRRRWMSEDPQGVKMFERLGTGGEDRAEAIRQREESLGKLCALPWKAREAQLRQVPDIPPFNIAPGQYELQREITRAQVRIALAAVAARAGRSDFARTVEDPFTQAPLRWAGGAPYSVGPDGTDQQGKASYKAVPFAQGIGTGDILPGR